MATNWSEVEKIVRAAEEHGTVGVTIVAPDGEHWNHNGSRQFKAASCV